MPALEGAVLQVEHVAPADRQCGGGVLVGGRAVRIVGLARGCGLVLVRCGTGVGVGAAGSTGCGLVLGRQLVGEGRIGDGHLAHRVLLEGAVEPDLQLHAMCVAGADGQRERRVLDDPRHAHGQAWTLRVDEHAQRALGDVACRVGGGDGDDLRALRQRDLDGATRVVGLRDLHGARTCATGADVEHGADLGADGQSHRGRGDDRHALGDVGARAGLGGRRRDDASRRRGGVDGEAPALGQRAVQQARAAHGRLHVVRAVGEPIGLQLDASSVVEHLDVLGIDRATVDRRLDVVGLDAGRVRDAQHERRGGVVGQLRRRRVVQARHREHGRRGEAGGQHEQPAEQREHAARRATSTRRHGRGVLGHERRARDRTLGGADRAAGPGWGSSKAHDATKGTQHRNHSQRPPTCRGAGRPRTRPPRPCRSNIACSREIMRGRVDPADGSLGQAAAEGALGRRNLSFHTRQMASSTMLLFIFDSPNSRSMKMTGTSWTEKPALTVRYLSSIWNM